MKAHLTWPSRQYEQCIKEVTNQGQCKFKNKKIYSNQWTKGGAPSFSQNLGACWGLNSFIYISSYDVGLE
jgi:hypothetical protein